MNEIKINKQPNNYGYYGITYFENGSWKHFVMTTLELARMWVAEKLNFNASLVFNGSKFEVWRENN